MTSADKSNAKRPYIFRAVNSEILAEEMRAIGVSSDGIGIMLPKGLSLGIKMFGLSAPRAMILKEQMLSLGGDAAQSRDVLTDSTSKTDVLLLGTEAQFGRLVGLLKRQQFGLPALAKQIGQLLNNWGNRPSLFTARGKHLDLTKRTGVMGILNVTPDSFSDGGEFLDPKAAIDRALMMQEAGADIVDIGAESTRPGAAAVSAKEELDRLLPVVGAVAGELRAILSVDTYKSDVAAAVLDCGADMINDISGLHFDRRMAEVVAKHGAGLAVMHIQGTPRNMQESPHYDDLIGEIYSYLAWSCSAALEAGVDRQSIMADPGIGFGKTLEHNLKLINELSSFRGLGVPILIGTSRKSFIGQILGKPVQERLYGTAASVAAAIVRGADIVRVHDVSMMREVCDVTDAIVRP